MVDEIGIVGVGPGNTLPQPQVGQGASRDEAGPSFKEMLTNSLDEVRTLQVQADDAIRSLVAGEVTDVTEAMVAVERADLAFNTMMQIRNKIIQAYEEVMRMSV